MRTARDERTREHGSVKAELKHGFLDTVAPGFQCFGNAEAPFVVGDAVGNDVDQRQATPRHW